MAPKKFGKYEVLARLATGGAANIFLARQPGAAGFHKLVCLKTLLPERASDADFVAMFLDEARLAARLNHPNCVQIYDLGRVRGSYYISMEYIFGETLWNLLATVTKLRTPLPAPHVAAIIASVCDGLHHAHELKDSNGRPYNLVHRDVSPQNIMVTLEGQTKVVDFGIAKAETGRAPTIAGIVKGKFSYMSPEQITGGSIDRRSDVYSLGIVLFECLASRRLYRGDSPEDIARLILEHRAPRLKDVVPDMAPALDSICATALARHPSKRYQTAQAMGEALRDYLDSIRYAHSAAAIARLVEERFKGQIPERRKVFESALAGTYDEKHLLEVLDARPAREIDLFPEDDPPPDAGDFNEASNVAEVASALAMSVPPPEDGSERPNTETLQSTDAYEGEDLEDATNDVALTGEEDVAPDPAVREPPGWRIELEPSGVDRAPVSVMTQSEPAHDDDDDDPYDDRTRVDGDDIEADDSFLAPGSENTRVDFDDGFDDQTEHPRVPVDGPTRVELGSVAPFAEPLGTGDALSGILMSGGDSDVATFGAEGTVDEKTHLDANEHLEAETGPFDNVKHLSLRAPSVAAVPPRPAKTTSVQVAIPSSETAPATPPPRRASALVRPTSVSVGAAQGRSGPTITRSPGQGAEPGWQAATSPNDFGEPTSVESAVIAPVANGTEAPAEATHARVRVPGLAEPSTLTANLADQAAAEMAAGDVSSLIRPGTTAMMGRETSSSNGAQLAAQSAQIVPEFGGGTAILGTATPAAQLSSPGQLETGAMPVQQGGRYTLSTVLAALGFGLAAGIVIGLLIARYATAPVSIPITPVEETVP